MSRRTKRAGAEAEGRREVDPGELLNGGAESNYWFFDPLAPSLPLWQMGWLDFEKLCTQLIKACDNDVLQAFRYGALQQGQGGIDILAVRRSTQKKLVLECKCVRKLRPGEIARCIDRLLSRADLNEIDQWILCVTVDVQRNKHLLEEWHKAVNRLRPLHIEPLIWGLRELDDRLRVQPEVVSRFFGAEVAARFCGKVVLQNEWPTAYHRQRVSDRAIENYSVKLDVFWPKERSSGVSAAFYFSRADLSGISLAIDGATLVRWMQWAAHAGPGQEIPFIPAAPRESKFVLMAPTARLQLQRSEVEDLRWVLR